MKLFFYGIKIVIMTIIPFMLNAQIKIKMEKEGGVYTVPCTVNGLALRFIFDTGASDVSISLTEAAFMLKNGYLSKNDLGETVYYSIANGTTAKGTKIVLKEIGFAGLKLYNVEASIVHELAAPLLLGQSAIEKLGPIQLNGRDLIILNRKASFDFKPIGKQSGLSNNMEILFNIKELEFGKIDQYPKSHLNITHKKSTFGSSIYLKYLNENGEFQNILNIDQSQIVIVYKNVIRIYEDSKIFYYYYVYCNGYYGLIENIYLENI